MAAILAQKQEQVRKLNLTFLSGHGVRAFDEQGAIFAERLCGDAIFQIRERVGKPLFRMMDDKACLRMSQEPPFEEDLRKKGGKAIHWRGKDEHTVLPRTIMRS